MKNHAPGADREAWFSNSDQATNNSAVVSEPANSAQGITIAKIWKSRKPSRRKLPKTERTARALRQRVAHDRSKGHAIQRENYLRRLMGLPPRQEGDPP